MNTIKKIVLLGAGVFLFGAVIAAPYAHALAGPVTAQFQANHATQIADGGTATGATVFLDVTIPADNDSQTQNAQCPLPLRPVVTETDNFDDYTVTGIEIKPLATPFNGTGVVAGTASTNAAGDTVVSFPEPTLALNGSYHWQAYYSHVTGSLQILCLGAPRDFRHTTTGTTAPLTFVFTPAPPPSATITVASRNSVRATTPVASSWDFSTPKDPCLLQGCTNISSATYDNVILGKYQIVPGQAPAHYAFNSIERMPIATNYDKSSLVGSLLSFGKDLLGSVANAVTECGLVGGIPTTCTIPVPAITLSAPGQTANFIILWDPIAAMTLNPATVALTSATPSQTIAISNTGAPGSSLTWATSIAPVSATWLTVTPASDAAGVAQGASEPVVFLANTASLAPGPYTATVKFSAVSNPTGDFLAVQTVTVNLVVTPPATVCGNGPPAEVGEQCDNGPANGVCPATCSSSCTTQVCPPQPSCSFIASPLSIVVPEKSNLIYSCVHVTTCNMLGGQFGGSPGQALSVTGNVASGTLPVAPTKDTKYTLNCYGELPPPGSNTNYQQNVNVNVTVKAPGRIETNP